MADIMNSQITEQVQSQVQYEHAGNIIASQDAEIARMREILRQIDELEVVFDKVCRIRDTIKQLRLRVVTTYLVI
jgi:protein-arginine kinase activator protein McsA